MRLHPRKLQDYAMGEELEAAERLAVEAHLARCARCRREVAAMRQALAMAVQALPPVTPSTAARQRALEAASAAMAQARRESRPAQETPPSTAGRGLAAGHWWGPSLALAVAALLLVTGLGLERQARWSAVEAERALVAAWLTRDDVVSRPLPASGGSRSPGTVMVAEDGVVLVVLRSAAPRGMGYQVWGQSMEGGSAAAIPVSLGLTSGTVLRLDATSYTHLSISVEPRGGSARPTTVLGRVPLGS